MADINIPEPKHWTMSLERTRSGTWFVTCDNIPGLIGSGGTIPDALRNAAQGIEQMALAISIALARGEKVAPMFKDI